jgi:hypothetical protein
VCGICSTDRKTRNTNKILLQTSGGKKSLGRSWHIAQNRIQKMIFKYDDEISVSMKVAYFFSRKTVRHAVYQGPNKRTD